MNTQTMVNLTIDGKAVSVRKGTTVYTAATQLGIEIPIFCYQDRMPPFGACRVCLVEVEKMNKLQTSCTLEATEGMVVNTQTEMAAEGRRGILEFLLINHPLDCPICDRGGECPLQDQALHYGPGLSRFFEEKRRFKKPIPLGSVLMLDRERCIVCARCTRFGEIVAGDHALEFLERGFKTEVGTPDGGPAESKFIGNTIMICPVGALTSDVYRFRARPWDNDATESACTLCPVGCSMILDSRDGEIVRTRSKENKSLNDIWLCDKGWFGYEFTDHPDRLKRPLARREGKLESISWEEAFTLFVQRIKEYQPRKKIAGWGGNPLTTEESYLFQKLMREVIGVDHLDHRIGLGLEEEGISPGMEISIGECEELSHALLFGLDLTEEFPLVWLRLKQAINRGAKVTFIGHYAPEIAPHLAQTILHPPGKELQMIRQFVPEKGKKGALFVGRQYLSHPLRLSILAELSKLQRDAQLSLNIMEGRGNSMGARFAGMQPNKGGLNPLQLLEEASRTGWDLLYVAGANPVVKYPSQLWKEAREKIGFVVVQDLFLTETAQQADLVLPTLSYVEKNGSFINIAGQVQWLLPGKDIPENIYSDGIIFSMLAERFGVELKLDRTFLESLKSFRLKRNNEVKPMNGASLPLEEGRLAATFAPALFDHGVRMKHNPHLVHLAKEPRARIHPSEGEKRGLKEGQKVHLTANGKTIEAKIKLDERVAEQTIVLPLGFPEIPVREFGAQLLNGLGIEIHG